MVRLEGKGRGEGRVGGEQGSCASAAQQAERRGRQHSRLGSGWSKSGRCSGWRPLLGAVLAVQ